MAKNLPADVDIEWWLSLGAENVRICADRAATAIISDPPPPSALITRPDLLRVGGMPECPDPATEREQKRYSLALRNFFAHWRGRVLESLGRFPKTVTGHGFELLTSEDTVANAAIDGYRGARRVLGAAQFVINSVPAENLTTEQAQQARDELTRMGRLSLELETNHIRARKTYQLTGRVETPSLPNRSRLIDDGEE